MNSLIAKYRSILEPSLSKGLLFGVGALFVYMPFHVFFSQWLSVYTGGLDYWKGAKDVILFVVTLLCILTVYLQRKQTKFFTIIILLSFLYGCIHLLLILITDQPYDTGLLATVYNSRIHWFLIVGISLSLLFPRKNLYNRFVKILITVSTLVCIFGILQRFLPDDFMANFGYAVDRGVKPNFFIDDKPDFPRIFSTLRDPNSLGAFLILPIIILTQKLIKRWRSSDRMLLAGLLGIHLLATFLTFSRSTLLATIFAVTILVVFNFRDWLVKHRKILLPIIVGIFMVLGGLFWITKDSYVTQNLVLHADESTTLADPNELRIDFMRQTVLGIIDQPFGHGPGTAGLVSIRLAGGGLLTENYFLQILYEVGIIGFGVFVWILWLVINKLRGAIFSGDKSLVVLASLAGLLFASLLFHTFANEAIAMSWFMMVGLAIKSKE